MILAYWGPENDKASYRAARHEPKPHPAGLSNPARNSWGLAKVWPPRSAHSTVEFNGQLWVLAGSDGDYLNDVWALKLNGADAVSDTVMARAIKWLYKASTRKGADRFTLVVHRGPHPATLEQ